MGRPRKKKPDEPEVPSEKLPSEEPQEPAPEEQPMVPEENETANSEDEEGEGIPEDEDNKAEVEPENEEPEDEGEEKQLADVLYEAFLELEHEKQKLNEEKDRLDDVAQEIRDIIYAPIKKDSQGKLIPPKEFSDPEGFRNKLDTISDFVGQALDYVIRLEKARNKYNFPMGETPEQLTGAPEPENQAQSPQQPVNVNVSQPQPQQKSGFWDTRIAKIQFKAYQLQLDAEKNASKHPIVSEEKVGDVLEFGRQLIPAINRVKAWFPGVIASFRFFQNENRYFVRHQELATYLGQMLGTLSSFVSAYVEYKKSVIDGRKVSLTKSFARIVEAQSGGMAPPIVQKGGTFMSKGAELGPGGFKQRK